MALLLFRAILGVGPEAPAQADNGRQLHLVNCLFDSLRRPSQHDRRALRPSPPPVVGGKGFQSCNKAVGGDQRGSLLLPCLLPTRPCLLPTRNPLMLNTDLFNDEDTALMANELQQLQQCLPVQQVRPTRRVLSFPSWSRPSHIEDGLKSVRGA